MKKSLKSLVVLSSLAVSAGTANAQLIAYDGFNYPAGVNLTINGNAGLGWVAPWSAAYGSSFVIDTVGSGYAVGGYSLQRAGRRIFGTHCGNQRTINLSQPLGNTTETVWVSFIAQQTSGSTSQNWLGVKLPCTPGAGVDQFIYIGKPYTRPAWGLDPGGISRHLIGSNSVYSKSFLVARIDLRPGLDDVRVWVNPGLNGVPSNASASVTALNVGNFEGITKAITEVGSTSGVVVGNIDELRIGRSFADVAPKVDGVLFMGHQVTAMGSAQLTQTSGALAISILGGVGDDGVRIDMPSLGNALQIDTGPIANGQSFSLAHFNSDNIRIASNTVQRASGGVLQFHSDFSSVSGVPVESLQMTVYDDNGNITNQATFPGASGTINLDPQMMDLPCSGGWPRYWYQTFEIDRTGPLTPTSMRLVWRFGCGEDALRQNANSVVINAFLADDGGGTGHIDDKNPTRIQATGTNIDDFTILRASSLFSGAAVTGIGSVALSEACSDGTNCSDLAQRRVNSEAIGGTGQDGVDFTFDEPASTASYLWINPPTFATTTNAQASQTLHAVTVGGDPKSVTVTSTPDGSGGVNTTFDASQLGATMVEFSISNNGVVVGTGVSPINALVVHSDPGTWTSNDWATYWFIAEFGWGTNWTSPFDPDKFAFVVNTPNGPASGNQLDLNFLDGTQVSGITGFSLTTQNVSGTSSIRNLVFMPVTPPCPADFNQDGFLDFFDYDAFVGAFEAGVSDADFNQDGFIDFFDYSDFVGAFEVGC